MIAKPPLFSIRPLRVFLFTPESFSPRIRKILLENSNEQSVKKSRAMVGAQSAVHSDFSEANSIFSKFYRRAGLFLVLFCGHKREPTESLYPETSSG